MFLRVSFAGVSLACAAAFPGAFVASATGQVRWTAVALSGQRAPGTPEGVVFSAGFQQAQLHEAGDIAFLAQITGPGVDAATDVALWRGHPLQLVRIAREGDAIEDSTLVGFSTFILDSSEHITFAGYTAGQTAGLFTRTSARYDTLSLYGGTIPGPLPGWSWRGPSAYAASERITAGVYRSFGPRSWPADCVIGYGNGGEMRAVAYGGDPAAGFPVGTTYSSFALCDISPSGDFLFTGQALSANGVSRSAIWAARESDIRLHAAVHERAPTGVPGALFTDIGPPWMTTGGRIYFMAFTTSNLGPCLFEGQAGSPRLALRGPIRVTGLESGWTANLGRNIAVSPGGNSILIEISPRNADGQSFLNGLASGGIDSLSLVARLGEQSPGYPSGTTFSSFNTAQFHCSDTGFAVFTASVRLPENEARSGAWAASPSGDVELLAGAGVSFTVAPGDVRTVQRLQLMARGSSGPMNARALDVHGRVALILNFTDGSSGVFLAQIPAQCRVDFDNSGGIDGGDVEAFFYAWAASEIRADMNLDGGIDGSDIAVFFDLWQEGC
ncbi:MAG: hypothetical protein JNK25_08170 [Phycisphaerae bacterium]|nr:hypothetical protein [Phycisphaerae bacterium]